MLPDSWRRWWRHSPPRLARFVLHRDLSEGWFVLILAALIGVAAGLAIVAFYGAVDLVERGIRASLSGDATTIGWASLVVLPAGLFLARWVRGKEERDRGGTMIPELILAAAGRGGDLPAKKMGRGLLSAVLTLGVGGSLGSEGPVALAGGTVGSSVGKLLAFRPGRVKVLLACGAAAGISAAFHAPIAGVMFALEIVLGSFTVVALTPIIVSSVLGAVISHVYLGTTAAFKVPREFALTSAPQLLFYALLGLGTGFVAVLFVRVFFTTQHLFAKLPARGILAPVLAGALVAAGGLLRPELLGPGRQQVQMLLFGQLAGSAALALGMLKIVASGLTIAGGGAGGVFTPSLLVGASFGSFFGFSLQELLPGLSVDPRAFALVGMAGLLAGSTAAPLTAILIVFEMTGDYGLILPLMLVCVVSYLVADRVAGRSLYSETLARRGERIRHGVDLSVLESVRVEECYNREPVTVRRGTPFAELLDRLRESGQLDFPVVSEDQQLVGVLSYQEIARALAEREVAEVLVAADLMREDAESVTPGDTLLTAMRRMSARDLDFIPVVAGQDSDRLLGLLRRADVMETYQAHLTLEE